MIKNLKNKTGEIYILTCVLILIILLLFSLTFTFAILNYEIETEKRNIKIDLENYLTKKSIQIFDNLKQGYISKDELKDMDFTQDAYEYISIVCPNNMIVENINITQDTDNGISIELTCDISIFMPVIFVPYTYSGNLDIKASYIPIMN